MMYGTLGDYIKLDDSDNLQRGIEEGIIDFLFLGWSLSNRNTGCNHVVLVRCVL